MALQSSQRLGPYEILAAVGAGGMGEVYRARDTRLDRTVAVKVLPAHLADKPELRERFEREARTIASLNHPHICTLYDIGHQDGTDYLVLEYLEGETLAERLKKGPLPLDQVLRYAIEIADALDKAHRKGITHRDLKPGNILLTKSGAKLLDFGLAKLRQETAPANISLSKLPTANDAITANGAILGTVQYMAPEQLEGREADARTDIFAFGVVVYEIATGKKAFEGKSQASVIAKILDSDPPPISSVQPMTPPVLDRAVKKCLAKEPEKRWQDASDLCDELKWIAEGGSHSGIPALVVTTRKSPLNNIRVAWSVGAVASAVLMAVLTVGGFVFSRRALERTVRFSISPPDMWNFAQLPGEGISPAPLAISPDGQWLAFVAVNAEGKSLLWVRSLDALTARMLPGTEGGSQPFWSPDSRFLAFFAGGKLKKIDVSGGPPLTLCDAPLGVGGGWSRDGGIIFAVNQPGVPIQRVSASGGAAAAAMKLGQSETIQARPAFLPDGRHFLYRGSLGSAGLPIYLASLDSADGKLLLNADAAPVLYSAGHLLFLREETLMAQRFDLRKLEFAGDAFPIAEQIQTSQTGNPNAFFSASENGVLAYQTGADATGTRLLWFDRTGKQIGTLGDAARYTDLALSPDGKQVGVSIRDGKGRDIWLYDAARGLRTRFTFDSAGAITSLWSPDSSRVVFNSRRKGHLDLYQKAASGAGNEELLLDDDREKYPLSWSPDGKFLMYASYGGQTGLDLFVLPLSGDRKPFPFLNTQFNEGAGRFSPDGRWVVYSSNESGRDEVYVAPFPGPGGKWQVSTGGGTLPRWRRDGTEIFYIAPDSMMVAAAVNGKGSNFEVNSVKPLFQTRIAVTRDEYDVSSDGQRFLVNVLSEQTASAPITVVLNWTAGLKK